MAIDTQSPVDVLGRLDRTAASCEASWRLRDGTLVWPRFAQPPCACEERSEIVAEDADRRVVGRVGYRRVYGPRAVLSLEAADAFWCLGLPAALLDEARALADLGGISTLLLRAAASDARTLALLCDERGARSRRDGDHVDIELALRHDHAAARQVPAA